LGSGWPSRQGRCRRDEVNVAHTRRRGGRVAARGARAAAGDAADWLLNDRTLFDQTSRTSAASEILVMQSIHNWHRQRATTRTARRRSYKVPVLMDNLASSTTIQ